MFGRMETGLEGWDIIQCFAKILEAYHVYVTFEAVMIAVL